MKTTTFLFALTGAFLSNNISSQTLQAKPDRKEIFIALKFCPSITWDKFGSYGNIVNYEKSYRFVINGGLEATFEISKKKWFLETGLLYSDFGFREKQSSAFYPNTDIHYVVEKNRYTSLSLSIIRRFKIIYFGGGFTPSYFINRQRIVDGRKYEYNTPLYYVYRSNGSWDYWLFGLQAKTGIMIKLNSNWLIKSELQISSSGIGDGFYNFGLGVSIDYKIK